jgi:DNA-directed RNA polymerase subunit RPC12/RpoP
MIYQCPGNINMRTPIIKLKKCPQCGEEVELFSIDMKVDCPACGQHVYNNINSCIDYCEYAEKCLGTETYQKLKK